jgi:hypothetical protein
MKRSVIATAGVLVAAAAATATPVLQFDVDGFGIQARNSAGVNTQITLGNYSTFNGSINFTGLPTGNMVGMFIQSVASGPFAPAAGFVAGTPTLTGQIVLSGGAIAAGSSMTLLMGLNSYTCNITPGSGALATTVTPGGFKIEGLTRNGAFSGLGAGNTYAGVNVTPWFSTQGFPGGLPGSFLEFNFQQNGTGGGSSDIDLFVDVAPLPSAAWAGLGMLGGMLVVRRLRRR